MIEKPFEGKFSSISRRELITGAGKVAAGVAIVTAAGGTFVAEAAPKAAEYPWPYKKLDPEHVSDLAYNYWYKDFCAYATAGAILQALREQVGEPYTSLPIEAFRWGHGGGVGWGMTCGTLMGAGMAAAFASGKTGEKIINDVINYYAATQLPVYKPQKPKAQIKNINMSDSPLCHVSVGRWMKKEGVEFGSPQRRERCARLSADVAAETVRLLNLWADGKYKPKFGEQLAKYNITAQNNCGDCHTNK